MASWTAKPVLSDRLRTIAEMVGSTGVHADIGSDHGLMPKHLLDSGLAQHVWVVEKNQQPFENASFYLKWSAATVLLGDGLGPLEVPLDSLSISGMGAKLMVDIVSAYPQKLPKRLVFQPNTNAEPLRRWAIEAGYALVEECLLFEHKWCEIVVFERSVQPLAVYEGLNLEVAAVYGPLLLRSQDANLRDILLEGQAYYTKRVNAGQPVALAEKLRLIEAALLHF